MQINYQRLRLPWLSIGQSLRARLGRGEEHRDRKFERRGALPDADPAHGTLQRGSLPDRLHVGFLERLVHVQRELREWDGGALPRFLHGGCERPVGSGGLLVVVGPAECMTAFMFLLSTRSSPPPPWIKAVIMFV